MPDYSLLEHMIFRGFLTTEVDVGGVPIVLKTLNEVEHDIVNLQSYLHDAEWQKPASYFLAYSTLFFNHENILPHRTQHIPVLAEEYEKMPASVLVSLLTCVNHINKKAASLLPLVEGFVYGVRSRQLWYMYRDMALCDSRCTGFEGTELLGLNTHQRLWAYFNTMEDEENQYIQQYQMAKFIVSPHAPKEIKKMDQADDKKLRVREKRRKALHEGRDASIIEENNEIRITDETAEELLDQMERTVRGEKDYHDLIVERHKQRIREGYLRRQQEVAERRRQTVQQRRDNYRYAANLAREGYSADEVAHYLEVSDLERRQRLKNADEDLPIEHKEAALLRWGFLDIEDVPEERRFYHEPDNAPEPSIENPLIKEHYQKVSEDLNNMRPPRPFRDGDDEDPS